MMGAEGVIDDAKAEDGISENLKRIRSWRRKRRKMTYFLPRKLRKPIIVLSAFFTSCGVA